MNPIIDVLKIRNRVQRAKQGEEPKALVGYGVRGIQDMLLASSRQPGIRGASELVRRFGRECANINGHIFSAGGRGMLLVPQSDVERTERQVRQIFNRTLPLGRLTIAHVPFAADREAGSIAWLRRVQEVRRDTAKRGTAPIASPRGATMCPSCYQRPGEKPIHWPGEKKKQAICTPCKRLFDADPAQRGEASRSLTELTESNRLAMVSADGNDMGGLFASLHSLEAQAAASDIIAEVFLRALRGLQEHFSRRTLVPITGGDDVRAFLDPALLAGFVSSLVQQIHDLAAQAAMELEEIDVEAAKRVRKMGIGVGVVVTNKTFPATRMASMARQLERRAKRLCSGRGGQSARSAADLCFVIAGDELDQGIDAATTALSFEGPGRTWDEFVQQAVALTHVGSTQRALLLRDRGDDDLFANQFRYQVARTRAWQRYLDDIGINWRGPDQVLSGAPDARDHEMAKLLEGLV